MGNTNSRGDDRKSLRALKPTRIKSNRSLVKSAHEDADTLSKYAQVSVNEADLIQKYSNYKSSQVDYLSNSNHSTTTINTASTFDITSHHSVATEHSIMDYSSEMMLKELYMLCETSPERRRHRDITHRLHYLLKRTWGGNYKVPLDNPSLIIDWCCATAVWDIELAFEYPNAKILGIDYETATVSSITNAVKNFSFHNAMIHEGKTGLTEIADNTVDFIMLRDVWLVNSPVIKWVQLLKQIYRILKPGGYIEIYEQDTNFQSMGPNLTLLEQWSDRFYEAIKLDRNTNTSIGSLLQDQHFVNIQHESKDLPIGEWPSDKDLKETGYLQRDLIERRFKENKRWYCKFNTITEREYTSTLINAIDECDQHQTFVRSLYFSAQKPSSSSKSPI